MSKEELQSIIYDVRTSAQEKGNIFSLMSCALYTMSVEAFGKLGATHLWWYIFESDENKFGSFIKRCYLCNVKQIRYGKDI